MASLGSGLRTLGAAFDASQMAAREQEKLELARAREERLMEKQQLESERQTKANDAFRMASSAEDQVRLLFDMWRNMTIEVDTLRNEITRLRSEVDTLKCQSYNQFQNTGIGGPSGPSIISNEYYNQM